MIFSDIENKAIALIVTNVDKERDIRVFLGKIEMVRGDYCFKNEAKGWSVPLDADMIERVRKVPEGVRDILLNADYSLNMTISDVGDQEGPFTETGMKWQD